MARAATALAEDDDNSTAAPASNLPSTSISGQLPQAVARRNSRRGGTPNAPEVDDEAAPAQNGPTAVNGGPSPQAIANMSDYSRGAGGPDQPMSYGESVGTAAKAFLGFPTRMVGRLLGVPAYQPQGAPQATPQATPSIAAAAPAPAEPTFGPDNARGSSALAFNAPMATGAPTQVQAGQDEAIKKVPTSYQAPAAGPSFDISQPPTMTTEQANAFYGAQRRADQAKDAADVQTRSDLMTEQARRATASFESQKILGGTDLFRLENAAARGDRGAGLRAAQLRATGLDQQAIANAPSTVKRDYQGEAAAAGKSVLEQQVGQESLNQARITNPMHAAALAQSLQAGGTQQEIAKLTLAGHKSRQQIIDELAKTTDPERHLQLSNALLVMEGKPPIEPYAMNVTPGRFDMMGNYLPGETTVMHKGTGQIQKIGSEAPMSGPSVKKTFGSFGEGDRIKGKDGRYYIVKNGQPVPE